MKQLLSFLFLVTCICACSDPNLELEEADLIGVWRSENSYINNTPASEFINGSKLYSTILGLKKDNFYFLNYSSGDWSINEDKLNLSNQGTYTITSYTDSIFTMEGEVFAGQLYWNLEGIPEDEIILFREDYRRD